jgi:hypothetical protein
MLLIIGNEIDVHLRDGSRLVAVDDRIEERRKGAAFIGGEWMMADTVEPLGAFSALTKDFLTEGCRMKVDVGAALGFGGGAGALRVSISG